MTVESVYSQIHETFLRCAEANAYNQTDFAELSALIQKANCESRRAFKEIILKILNLEKQNFGHFFRFFDRFFEALFAFLAKKRANAATTAFLRDLIAFFAARLRSPNHTVRAVFLRYLRLVLVDAALLDDCDGAAFADAMRGALAEPQMRQKLAAIDVLRVAQRNAQFAAFARAAFIGAVSRDAVAEVRKAALRSVEISAETANALVFRCFDADQSVRVELYQKFLEEKVDICALNANSRYSLMYYALSKGTSQTREFFFRLLFGAEPSPKETVERVRALLAFDFELCLIYEKLFFTISSFLDAFFAFASSAVLRFLIADCVARVFDDRRDAPRFQTSVLVLERLKRYLEGAAAPGERPRADVEQLLEAFEQALPTWLKVAQIAARLLQGGAERFGKCFYLRFMARLHVEEQFREALLRLTADVLSAFRRKPNDHLAAVATAQKRVEAEFGETADESTFVRASDFCLFYDYFTARPMCVLTDVDLARALFAILPAAAPDQSEAAMELFAAQLVPRDAANRDEVLNCLILMRFALAANYSLPNAVLDVLKSARGMLKRAEQSDAARFFDLNYFACFAHLLLAAPESFLLSRSMLEDRLARPALRHSAPLVYAAIFDFLVGVGFEELNATRNALLRRQERPWDVDLLLERLRLQLLLEGGRERAVIVRGFIKLLLFQPTMLKQCGIGRREVMATLILLWFDDNLRAEGESGHQLLQELTHFFHQATTRSREHCTRTVLDFLCLLELLGELRTRERVINPTVVRFDARDRQSLLRLCENFLWMAGQGDWREAARRDKSFGVAPHVLIPTFLLYKSAEREEWLGVANDIARVCRVFDAGEQSLALLLHSIDQSAIPEDGEELRRLRQEVVERLAERFGVDSADALQAKLVEREGENAEIRTFFYEKFDSLREKARVYAKTLDEKRLLEEMPETVRRRAKRKKCD